jgi:hypothetical protein
MATITLEAAVDYNLWFWHAAYGFSGCLNDVNVLGLSPLLDRMTNGTLSRVEAEAGVVPFFIDGEMEGFNKTYFLVDGIYPRYTRFVKGMREQVGTHCLNLKFLFCTAWNRPQGRSMYSSWGTPEGASETM